MGCGMKDLKGVPYFRGVSLRRRGKKREGLGVACRERLAVEYGLVVGCVLRAYGGRYVFSGVGGLGDDGAPWVWAYKLKKNGKTYSEPTRLDRWEKECTSS